MTTLVLNLIDRNTQTIPTGHFVQQIWRQCALSYDRAGEDFVISAHWLWRTRRPSSGLSSSVEHTASLLTGACSAWLPYLAASVPVMAPSPHQTYVNSCSPTARPVDKTKIQVGLTAQTSEILQATFPSIFLCPNCFVLGLVSEFVILYWLSAEMATSITSINLDPRKLSQ